MTDIIKQDATPALSPEDCPFIEESLVAGCDDCPVSVDCDVFNAMHEAAIKSQNDDDVFALSMANLGM